MTDAALKLGSADRELLDSGIADMVMARYSTLDRNSRMNVASLVSEALCITPARTQIQACEQRSRRTCANVCMTTIRRRESSGASPRRGRGPTSTTGEMVELGSNVAPAVGLPPRASPRRVLTIAIVLMSKY